MFKVADYSHARTFDEMGKVLHVDESQGLCIRAGQVFEGYTVKGNTNLIVTCRVKDGCMYYFHGDRAKKTKLEDFVRAVLHGEIWPQRHNQIDTGRLHMATIGIDAIANRRTAEEQIEYYGQDAMERFLRAS